MPMLCRVATRSSASEAQTLNRRHYHWLLESGQDEEAGRVKERDGDFVGAIMLFLQGGLPGKAAQVTLCLSHDCVLCAHSRQECTQRECTSTRNERNENVAIHP